MACDPMFVLTLAPVADPLARHGFPAREPIYRLKLCLKTMLQQHGLKNVQLADARLVAVVTLEELEALRKAADGAQSAPDKPRRAARTKKTR